MSLLAEDNSLLASPDGYASNDEEMYWTMPPLFVGNVKNQSLRTTKSAVSSQPDLNADGTVDGEDAKASLQSQRPAFSFQHAAITELELAASALGVTVPSHEQYMKAADLSGNGPVLLIPDNAKNNRIMSEGSAISIMQASIERFSTNTDKNQEEAYAALLDACQRARVEVKASKLRCEEDPELVSFCRSLLLQLSIAQSSLQDKLSKSGQDPANKELLQHAIRLVQLCGETCESLRPLYATESQNVELQELGNHCVETLTACFKAMQAFQNWVFSQLLPCRIEPCSIGTGQTLCQCWESAIKAMTAMSAWPECQQQALQALHTCLTTGAAAAATQLASRINREVEPPHSSPSQTPNSNHHAYSPPHHYGTPPPPPPPGMNPRYGNALSSPPPGLHHPTPFTPHNMPPLPPPLPIITTEDAMDKEAVQMLWCLLWAADSVMAAVPELTVLPLDEDREQGGGTPIAQLAASKAPSQAGTGTGDAGALEPDAARRAFFELCMSWTRRSEWMGAQLSRLLTKRPDSLDGEDSLVAAILQQRNDVLSFIVQWSTSWLCLTNDPKSTQQMDKLKRHAMKLITHSLEIYTMVSFPMPEPAHAPVPSGAENSKPNGVLANGDLSSHTTPLGAQDGKAKDGKTKDSKTKNGEAKAAKVVTANGMVLNGYAPGDKFWSLQWGGWQLIRPLGKGSSAQVWKARYHHADVALKLFQLDTPGINDQVQAELDTLRHLASHPNVVRFLGACWRTGGNGAQLAVMMEYCNAGTLHNTIDNARQPSRRRNNAKLQHFYTSWVNRLEIAQNVAAAVAFLHTQGTPHRDLTSYNVLLHYSDPWQAKVADLGLARLIAHPDMDLSMLDSIEHGPDAHWPAWIAPELFKSGTHYDCRADVYSFGVILWELVMLRHPWEQEPPPPPPPGMRPGKSSPAPAQPQPKTKFVPGDHPTFPQNTAMLEESMPKVAEVVELAEQCWQMDPVVRPTMGAVVSKLDGILSKVQRICKN